MCVRSYTPTLVRASNHAHIVDSDVVFWAPDAKVGEQAAFQVTLTAPKAVTIAALPFARVAIYFAGGDAPVVVEHATPSTEESADQGGAVNVVKLGTLALDDEAREPIKANLRWPLGSTAVFLGSIAAGVPTVLKVCGVLAACCITGS